jgi:hypothetical protein
MVNERLSLLACEMLIESVHRGSSALVRDDGGIIVRVECVSHLAAVRRNVVYWVTG